MKHAQNRKIGKPNDFKIFGCNKTKGPEQNRLWSVMYEGGRNSVLIILILFRNCEFQEIYLIKPRNAFYSVLIS